MIGTYNLSENSKTSIFLNTILLLKNFFEADIDFITIGQYLQPTPKHHGIRRFVTPKEFEGLRSMAVSKGFLYVSASPLTRSSYHADNNFRKLLVEKEKQLARYI